MAGLNLTDMAEAILDRLEERARRHGRTAEQEAKAVLTAALCGNASDPWAEVDAIYRRLAATGKTFSDSAELLREDRDR